MAARPSAQHVLPSRPRPRQIQAAEQARAPARGNLADYERVKAAYERLLREEPENLIGITLVGMDLDRARCALLGLPAPHRSEAFS
jgi:hypothetical protein